MIPAFAAMTATAKREMKDNEKTKTTKTTPSSEGRHPSVEGNNGNGNN
jgi:hypothetical protein